jgi:hypothetical protein
VNSPVLVPNRNDCVVMTLRWLGAEPDTPGYDWKLAYVKALFDSMEIMMERDATPGRKGIWMRSGLRGQAFQLMSNAERAFHTVFDEGGDYDPENVAPYLEDAINYAAFGLALIRIERTRGMWWLS